MVARCTANGDQERTFEVRVELDVLVPASFPVGVECFMRPVSFAPDTAVRILAVERRIASFKSMAFALSTAFFAVSVTASEKNWKLTQDFALKLPLIGAPEDRDARLLLALLSNRERLLRYLLMLLDDAGFDSARQHQRRQWKLGRLGFVRAVWHSAPGASHARLGRRPYAPRSYRAVGE